MRRYFGIIITIVIVLAVLVGLSAVQYTKLDRPEETEGRPNRSSYNTGPTGTRAFYQLLAENGYPVMRWNHEYRHLRNEAINATLILVGPSQDELYLPLKNNRELLDWVAAGGHALIISRDPGQEIGSGNVLGVPGNAQDEALLETAEAEKLIDHKSDALLTQPTTITRNVKGLAISRLARRLFFHAARTSSSAPSPASEAGPPGQKKEGPEESAEAEPIIEGDAATEPDDAESLKEVAGESVAGQFNRRIAKFSAPVIHLGDDQGAVLTDFDYGRGRIIFLADPFVIANNGISHGTNLTLALNLVNSLGGRERPIFFDEFLHGYHQAETTILGYFRGTSLSWMLMQGALIALLLAWSVSRRFARPLPLPQEDRHSPLEFVGSMANLQQAARARDLALENIYPRFRARLCRSLGLPARTSIEEIVGAINRRQLKIAPAEVRWVMRESEQALAGGETDDQRLTQLVATMRRITSQLNSPRK